MSLPELRKIAIIGASGNLGSHITRALLNTGKHQITAVTRQDSVSIFPEGISVQKVDYNDEETLVNALRDQDALVITLSGKSQEEHNLIKAAAKAGIRWVIPNEWGPDTTNESLVRDVPMFASKPATRKLLATIGIKYTSFVTGYWFSYSLVKSGALGITLANRKATVFDDGNAFVSLSTFEQIGDAVTALLSFPGVELERYCDRVVFVRSFTVSQNEILQELAGEWDIEHVVSREWFNQGVDEVKAGNMAGYKKMGCRVFFVDGAGDFENKVDTGLGLRKQSLADAIKDILTNGGHL